MNLISFYLVFWSHKTLFYFVILLFPSRRHSRAGICGTASELIRLFKCVSSHVLAWASALFICTVCVHGGLPKTCFFVVEGKQALAHHLWSGVGPSLLLGSETETRFGVIPKNTDRMMHGLLVLLWTLNHCEARKLEDTPLHRFCHNKRS